MYHPIFELASRSISRQRDFRRLLAAHLAVLGGALAVYVWVRAADLVEIVGFVLLVAGIVEGALVLGWRLTQLPRSRSLEPVLLSPVPAKQVMLGEQSVGLVLLFFLTLSSVPALAVLVGLGWLEWPVAVALLSLGFVWGCVTGLGLVWWAFEPKAVRRWGERLSMALLVVYLVVFGLLGERVLWALAVLPFELGILIQRSFLWMHWNNPFGLIVRLAQARDEGLLGDVLRMQGMGLALAAAFLLRAASRLKEHYLERHYRPITEENGKSRGHIADRPLAWWAVRRVNEYPGRVNLWMALAVSGLYSAYLLAGAAWPGWMGTYLFRVFETAGGIPGFTTVLVLLAAVPAAYQYGLWDSSVPERCNRLELLLLTELRPTDYLRASAAAAFNRGFGYFLAALFLWTSGLAAGRYDLAHWLLAVLAGAALILLYFAISFRTFARNRASVAIGFLLSVGLPLIVWAMGASGLVTVARHLPPGMVFYATRPNGTFTDALAAILATVALSVYLLSRAGATFDRELRQWYDENHGKRA